jgi:acetyl esterase/lipase
MESDALRGESYHDVMVFKNIPYAPPDPPTSRGHLLDLYVPVSSDGLPVVIWVRGSAWTLENGRDQAELVAANLNRDGFIVVGVAIRSTANAQFPAQLHDIKAAIRWLRANAEQYSIDQDRIAIMGESSGGWAAAMAATTGGIAELEGNVGVIGRSSQVQAAIPFYPPTDFLQMDQYMLQGCAPFNEAVGLKDCHADPGSPESRLIGGPIKAFPERVQRANPATYVSAEVPPFLILHGQLDSFVPYEQGLLLHTALAAAGANSTFITLPHGAHGEFNEFLIDPLVKKDATSMTAAGSNAGEPHPANPTWKAVTSFLRKSME